MKKTNPFHARGDRRPTPGARAFTLLEVALIVAIIGMMLMMIIGYLLSPKERKPLPPVDAPKLIPPSMAPVTPSPKVTATPAASSPTAATPAPAQTIELSPQSAPLFR